MQISSLVELRDRWNLRNNNNKVSLKEVPEAIMAMKTNELVNIGHT